MHLAFLLPLRCHLAAHSSRAAVLRHTPNHTRGQASDDRAAIVAARPPLPLSPGPMPRLSQRPTTTDGAGAAGYVVVEGSSCKVCVRQRWPPPPPASSSSRRRLDPATLFHGWDVARATQISVGVAWGHGSISVLGVLAPGLGLPSGAAAPPCVSQVGNEWRG
jgi:hypothetical protein